MRTSRALPTKLFQWRCAADGDTSGRGFGAGGRPKGGKPSKPSKKASVQKPKSAVPAASSESTSRLEAEKRGRKLMEQMRLEANEQPANPFKPKGPTLTEEELQPIDPSAGVMPEVVSQRMLKRVVPFAGLPVLGAALTFVGFWYANTQLELDLPPQIVAYATQALLLLSFAGITYGVMSTSWDEEEEGSLLGFENVGRNFDLMRGVESSRIAQARMDAEVADAEEAGIQMSPRSETRK